MYPTIQETSPNQPALEVGVSGPGWLGGKTGELLESSGSTGWTQQASSKQDRTCLKTR